MRQMCVLRLRKMERLLLLSLLSVGQDALYAPPGVSRTNVSDPEITRPTLRVEDVILSDSDNPRVTVSIVDRAPNAPPQKLHLGLMDASTQYNKGDLIDVTEEKLRQGGMLLEFLSDGDVINYRVPSFWRSSLCGAARVARSGRYRDQPLYIMDKKARFCYPEAGEVRTFGSPVLLTFILLKEFEKLNSTRELDQRQTYRKQTIQKALFLLINQFKAQENFLKN